MSVRPVPAGVSFLDHTADVGLEVLAPDLPELFSRAAAGMVCLIRGTERDAPADDVAAQPAGPTVARTLRLEAEDLPALLRSWLRELLHWHESEGLSFRSARFDVLEDARLQATVTLAPDAEEPIREIKGVTLHELLVERRGGEWAGRVIFDV